MKFLCSIITILVVIPSSALASSYDDFNQGIEAFNRGDSNATVVAFGKALAAAELAPGLRKIALFDRGETYLRQGNYAGAAADFNGVLKLDPKYAVAYAGRAKAESFTGRLPAAVQDCEAIDALVGEIPTFLCGPIAFEAGAYEKSARYFRQALKEQPTSSDRPYELLWLRLTELREGKPAGPDVIEAIRSIDGGKWPSPILKFFEGTETEGDLQAAATDADPSTERNRKCEVDFYVGEWKLAYRDRSAATALLQQASSQCPANYIEAVPAQYEIRNLMSGN